MKIKLVIFINGIVLGFLIALLLKPMYSSYVLSRNIDALYKDIPETVIQKTLEDLYKNEETAIAVDGIFYFNKDGRPAYPATKQAALKTIEKSEYFNVAGAISSAAAYDENVDTRLLAMNVYSEFLKINYHASLWTIIDTLEDENNEDVYKEKVELISRFLFVNEGEMSNKSKEEVVLCFKNKVGLLSPNP
ncbi:MAG: hypothetical protein ISS71_08890 [Phycisphaerae bacterium]|nr:hypothetical protein [Phycisphaerae bacterium]